MGAFGVQQSYGVTVLCSSVLAHVALLGLLLGCRCSWCELGDFCTSQKGWVCV